MAEESILLEHQIVTIGLVGPVCQVMTLESEPVGLQRAVLEVDGDVLPHETTAHLVIVIGQESPHPDVSLGGDLDLQGASLLLDGVLHLGVILGQEAFETEFERTLE